MTNPAPYTQDDVDLVHDAIVDARLAGHRDWTDRIARAVLDALAAAGRLAPVDIDPRHIIEIRETGWTIQHPLACRPNLFTCPVNKAGEGLTGPPAAPGRYECGITRPDGPLVIGDRVEAQASPATTIPVGLCPCTCHQPDRCPCRPGAPEHRHGAGGYCTVASPGYHVLAVADDRTWTVEHPADCTIIPRTGGPSAVVCLVEDLAREQLHDDQVPPSGRYEIASNDLGDRLCIFDRLDGPQPTAGRGCQCSTGDPVVTSEG